MNADLLLAVTTIGQEHRFLGMDWSYLSIIGIIGQLVFGSRFYVQWIASEKAGDSVIPLSFWYLSIAGSVILAIYFISRREPIGTLGALPNSIIYIRNLMLIKKKKLAMTAAAPSQTPVEQ